MTVEEINKLIKDEDDGMLRNPKTLSGLLEYDILKHHNILIIFIKYIIENPNREKFLNSIFGRRLMMLLGIQSFDNINPSIGIYHVQTTVGEGEFFDAHRLFETGRYPNWITEGHCFGNAYSYALKNSIKAKVVSGIGYIGKPFLHSVVLTYGGQVIDFNYNLVMTADLYFKLFNFEILAEVESKDIKETFELFNENRDLFKDNSFQTYTINFAFEDVLKYINKYGKKKISKVGEKR